MAVAVKGCLDPTMRAAIKRVPATLSSAVEVPWGGMRGGVEGFIQGPPSPRHPVRPVESTVAQALQLVALSGQVKWLAGAMGPGPAPRPEVLHMPGPCCCAVASCRRAAAQ